MAQEGVRKREEKEKGGRKEIFFPHGDKLSLLYSDWCKRGEREGGKKKAQYCQIFFPATKNSNTAL